MIDFFDYDDDDWSEVEDSNISEEQRRVENLAAEKIANKIFDKYNETLTTHIDRIIFDIVREDAKSYLNEEAKDTILREIKNYMEIHASDLIDRAIRNKIKKML